jgi:hypothetical protein
MGDNNNARAASLPQAPNPALGQLERLVGSWSVSGPEVSGETEFEWMEGDFFLIQHVNITAFGRAIKGAEYIGYDEDTRTLRSHFMDNHGSNFTYTWELEGDTLRVWFGERGSDNSFEGRFAEDGDSYSGAWRWPGGGYQATLTRLPS